jgi:hypothetical protein
VKQTTETGTIRESATIIRVTRRNDYASSFTGGNIPTMRPLPAGAGGRFVHRTQTSAIPCIPGKHRA